VNTGVEGLYQQWQILSQAGDAEQNLAIYPAPMDHRGDGYFQIINGNQTDGLNVLDSQNGTSGSAVVQNPQSYNADALTGNPSQEWDIQSAGNCGDIPARCTHPPLSTTGNYYTIINKATGLLLSAHGARADSTIDLSPPAAASNGDFTIPADQGQLWQIVPVHIAGRALYSFTGFQPPVANLPTVNSIHAGQDIPFKFSLGGDQGLGVIVPGYPTVTRVDCESHTPIAAAVKSDTASSSGLAYDSSTNTYTYVWKTEKQVAGTCQVLSLLLNDGSDHLAYFQFK
jgi:hypothetical protein